MPVEAEGELLPAEDVLGAGDGVVTADVVLAEVLGAGVGVPPPELEQAVMARADAITAAGSMLRIARS